MNEVAPARWYTSRTLVTQLVVGVVLVLRLAGVLPDDEELTGKLVDLVLVVGAIYVAWLRVEPSPPKPLTNGQTTALTATAMQIVGPPE